MRMKSFLCVLISLSLVISTSAQEDSDQLPYNGNRQKYSQARLYGKVIAAKTRKSVDAASVQVFVKAKDSMNQVKDSLIAGMLTKPNGDFSFENLPLPDSFTVKISGIGMGEVVRQLAFSGGKRKTTGYELDLGNIEIGETAAMLGAVTVV